MAVPARLSRKLREVLGPEAAEEMMALMNGTAALRQDVLSAIQRLDDRIQGVEVRLTKEIGNVKGEIGNVKADLMKWSFLFWVGAVSAIAMLAGVLQH